MNRLTAALAELCRQHVRTEKRLLAPDRRVGAQWVRQAVRSGTPAVNVRVTPLKALAFELAGTTLLKQRAVLVPTQGRRLLVEKIWREWSRANPGRPLSSLPLSPGFTQALADSLLSLRLAGLGPNDLEPSQFDDPGKGEDLATLLAHYEHQLRRRKWWDDARLFEVAIDQILKEPEALGSATLFLQPVDLPAHGFPRRLLDQLPEERRLILPVDEPGKIDPDEKASDLARLRFVDDIGSAPPMVGDGTVGFVRALGEANEARALFRRLLADGIPLDHVEALHTDAATYLPLLHETALLLPGPNAGEGETSPGLPVNFAEGLPAAFSRPGRALAAWLRWIEEGYPQQLLAQILQGGLLRLGEKEPTPALAAAWNAAFLRLEIYGERQRYFEAFSQAGLGGESEAWRRSLVELWAELRPLLELLPERPQPGELLKAAEAFLVRFSAGDAEFDNLCREALRGEISQQLEWLERTEGLSEFKALGWLSQLPDSVRANQQGPMPGTLHVAPWDRGGHSGRPITFLLGMDEERSRADRLQDALLLDSERRRLSPELPTTAELAAERRQARLRLLARLRGHATFSYSCLESAEGGEQRPSLLFRHALRLCHAGGDGDQEPAELLRAVGLVPAAAKEALTLSERWLLELSGRQATSAEALALWFPDRARGLAAMAARASVRFTEHDGKIGPLSGALSPFSENGLAFSANSLEALGACPLRFFFRHLLEAAPPPDREHDPEIWLSADVLGSLLHEVFRRYHADLSAAGLRPDFLRDAEMLNCILEAEVARVRQRRRTPRPDVAEAGLRQAAQTARLFLHEEAKHAAASRPLFLEANLGVGGAVVTPLDSAEPIRAPVAEGLHLRLRGRIDRIDEIGPPGSKRYAVWDYKTGGLSKYEASEEKPFNGGRLLQPLVYWLLSETRLRAVAGPAARVESIGYLFPGGGEGDRLQWSAEQLAGGRRLLLRLAELVARGAFVATDSKSDCEWCEHARICEGANIPEAAAGKRNEEANAELEPLRRIRSDAEEGAEEPDSSPKRRSRTARPGPS